MDGIRSFKIEDVSFVAKKWHPGFERKTSEGSLQTIDIKEIVIHGTGGLGTFEFVRDGGRKQEYIKGIALFHYIIEYDLDIIRQLASPSVWYYHSTSGGHDASTIGIELENPHKLNNAPYRDIQYEMLEYLIFDVLLKEYPSINKIVSHNYNAKKYSKSSAKTFCPGVLFKWEKVEGMLKSRNISFSRVEHECIEIFQ